MADHSRLAKLKDLNDDDFTSDEGPSSGKGSQSKSAILFTLLFLLLTTSPCSPQRTLRGIEDHF